MKVTGGFLFIAVMSQMITGSFADATTEATTPPLIITTNDDINMDVTMAMDTTDTVVYTATCVTTTCVTTLSGFVYTMLIFAATFFLLVMCA